VGGILNSHVPTSPTKNKKPRLFHGYIIAALGFFIMLIGFGALYSYGVFFKPLLLEFAWTRALTSGAFSLVFLVQGLLAIFAGRLTDRFGPRIVVTAAGIFLGLSFLLMSQISEIWQLYLSFGILWGIGQSGIIVPILSTVARWFSRRRGIMVGIVSAGIGGGQAVAPPIANHLIINFGWRTSYFIMGIIVLLAIVATAQFLKRDPSQIGLLPDGADREVQDCLEAEPTGLSLREAMHTMQLWILLIVYFCFGFFALATSVHIIPHTTDLGISAASAAAILSAIGGLSIIGRIGMGSAADRIGTKRILTVSFILTTAMLFWLFFIKELWMFYVFAAVFGFAWGGAIALQSPVSAESFGMKAHGAILGASVFGFSLGGSIGPLLAGYMFDVIGNYQLAFVVFAILSLLSIILTLLLKPAGSTDSIKTV
jgi:MFS family permease